MESWPFRPIWRRTAAALWLAAAALPSALSAQATAAADPAARTGFEAPSEVRIIAARQERSGDRLYATGDVEIHCGEFLLFADRVEYDLGTKDLLAEGNVIVQSGGDVLRAERIVTNLGTGRGTIEKASGLVPPSILFEAATLERKSDTLYGLSRARLTACAQPNPRWSFSLARADLRRDEYIDMHGAVVRIKGVPVLYLPYLRYPLKDRATGFLMPRVGFGGEKGFTFSQSFYWAMAPNMDATVGIDFYLARGTGAGLEYRYLLPGGTKGDLNLYYFIFKKEPDAANRARSSIVRLAQTVALPFGFTLVANVDYQSSYTFLRDYDNDFQRALSYNRTYQVFLSRSWRRFNLSAQASRFETYFSQLDDSNISTSLPQVTFNVFKTRLFAPVFFSLASSYARWQYGWKSAYDAGTQRRSSRLTLSPALSLPFASIPWLTATTTVTANLNFYGQSLDPETGGIVDEPLFTRNVAAQVEIVGPVLVRLFYGRDGRPRLKNIIEPYVTYKYDSPTNDVDRVVTSYGLFRYHQLSYGVTGRFLFKARDERAVEVFSLSLGQTYYLSPEDGPLSRFPVEGRAPRFSELTGTLRFYPQARFSLDAAVAYNPYYGNISTLRLGATAGSKAEGDFLTVSWFKSRNAWITGVDPALIALYDRDQVGAFGGVRLRGIGVDLQVEADYNVKDGKLLYTGGQLTYHYQCLDFLVDIRAFHYRVPADVQVRFSLGLGAIGKTLDFLGGFGF